MAKPLFFEYPSGLTVAEITSLTGAEPGQGAHLNHRIGNIAPLDLAGPGDLTYLDNAKYAGQLASTQASACLTTDQFVGRAPKGLTVLRVREPYRAFVTVARALFPDSLRPSSLFEAAGIASGAFVHPSARLENGAIIDAGP